MPVIVGALFIGLSLGLLGSGGSLLTVPTLLLLTDHPEKIAITESLAIVGLIAAVGSVQYGRRSLIDWRTVALAGAPLMAGSYLGAWISQWLPGTIQLLILAAVMLAAAYRMLAVSRSSEDSPPGRCRPGCLLWLGAGLGTLSGLVGVGGGFLIVPALVLMGGLSMPMAIGTSLVVITLGASIGFAKHLHLLHVAGTGIDWHTTAVFSLLGVGGMLIGQRFATRLPQTALKRIFSAVVAAMAVLVTLEAAHIL